MKSFFVTAITSLIAGSAFAGGGGSPSSYTAICEDRYILQAPFSGFQLTHYSAPNPDSTVLSFHVPVSVQHPSVGGFILSFDVKDPSVLTFTDLGENRLITVPDMDSPDQKGSQGRAGVLNVEGRKLNCAITQSN